MRAAGAPLPLGFFCRFVGYLTGLTFLPALACLRLIPRAIGIRAPRQSGEISGPCNSVIERTAANVLDQLNRAAAITAFMTPPCAMFPAAGLQRE